MICYLINVKTPRILTFCVFSSTISTQSLGLSTKAESNSSERGADLADQLQNDEKSKLYYISILVNYTTNERCRTVIFHVLVLLMMVML